jgi:hypothetical protein
MRLDYSRPRRDMHAHGINHAATKLDCFKQRGPRIPAQPFLPEFQATCLERRVAPNPSGVQIRDQSAHSHEPNVKETVAELG